MNILAFLSAIPLHRSCHVGFSPNIANRLITRNTTLSKTRVRFMPFTTISSISPPQAKKEDSQGELIKLIKAKGAQKAVRRIVTILEEAEARDGEYSDTNVRPDSFVYNSAIRSLIRAERPDLAHDVFRLRRSAQIKRPDDIQSDPTIAAAIIRSALRDAKKRSVRLSISDEVFKDLKEDCDALCNAPLSDKDALVRDVPRMALAFCTLISSFLDAVHKGNSVKVGDMERGMLALTYLQKISKEFEKTAAIEVREYNEAIRTLGKARLINSVFDILDIMSVCKVEKNNVTFEFIANSAVRQVQFVTGAVSMDTLPEPLGVEVAFVGRSNVGKSSLVNMVCNRKALAYVSGRPGKTQQFNYFLVNENDPKSKFFFVDLPGVGYAKVPRHIQEDWLHFMSQYLQYRVSLRLVFHLVDGRHGALKDDRELMSQMGAIRGAFDYVIVLTKMDKIAKQKVKQSVIDSTRAALRRNGCADDVPIVLTSAQSKLGRDDMWRHLQAALRPMSHTKEAMKEFKKGNT